MSLTWISSKMENDAPSYEPLLLPHISHWNLLEKNPSVLSPYNRLGSLAPINNQWDYFTISTQKNSGNLQDNFTRIIQDCDVLLNTKLSTAIICVPLYDSHLQHSWFRYLIWNLNNQNKTHQDSWKQSVKKIKLHNQQRTEMPAALSKSLRMALKVSGSRYDFRLH